MESRLRLCGTSHEPRWLGRRKVSCCAKRTRHMRQSGLSIRDGSQGSQQVMLKESEA